eukprot:3458550-Heterocapsa_arctica.AAC.1
MVVRGFQKGISSRGLPLCGDSLEGLRCQVAECIKGNHHRRPPRAARHGDGCPIRERRSSQRQVHPPHALPR